VTNEFIDLYIYIIKNSCRGYSVAILIKYIYILWDELIDKSQCTHICDIFLIRAEDTCGWFGHDYFAVWGAINKNICVCCTDSFAALKL
jgi:hypothetical protein